MYKKYSPWSLSKANVATQCSLRFDLQYKRRVRGRQIKNNAGRIGSAVHEYIDSILQEKSPEDAFRMACFNNKLTNDEQLTLLEYREPAGRFFDRLNQFITKRTAQGFTCTYRSEEKFMFKRDGTPVEDWFSNDSYWRGIVDVEITMMREGKRSIVIIDHKTGRPSLEKDASYEAQTKSYAVAAYLRYPDLVGVKTALHWLREDYDEDIFHWSPVISAKKIEEDLLPWFYGFYDEAQLATQVEPVANPGQHCTWCAHQFMCPLYGVK